MKPFMFKLDKQLCWQMKLPLDKTSFTLHDAAKHSSNKFPDIEMLEKCEVK